MDIFRNKEISYIWVATPDVVLLLYYFYSIAKLSFKGKQRNDPTEAERLGNVSTGTKVGRNKNNLEWKRLTQRTEFYLQEQTVW